MQLLHESRVLLLLAPVDVLLKALQGRSAYVALVVIYAVNMVLPIAGAVGNGLNLSPIGYQTNLMVFAPGRYRFLDFLRFGWPLSLSYSLLVPALLLW